MVKYVLLTSHFYLVSQVVFLKNINVTFRNDCQLAGIQGFHSVKFLGEYLALNTWQTPIEAHTEGRGYSLTEGRSRVPWSHAGHSRQYLSSGVCRGEHLAC